ncbi:MAG: DUF1559 domain-containing protein [Pirellulales bacterium]|nr:DUF1559 domain-containing protein [Pirellulales bacterium]
MISARRRGFTLVEILVVISIIGVMIGILIPAIYSARAAARTTQCLHNQQELGKAILHYDSSKRRLPAVVSTAPNPKDPANPLYSNWVIDIFPEIDRMDLFKAWRDGTGTDVEVPQLLCPSGDIANPKGGLSYFVNLGYVPVAGGSITANYQNRLFRIRVKNIMEPNMSLSDLRSTANIVMLSERSTDSRWAFKQTEYLPEVIQTLSVETADHPLCFRWAVRPADSHAESPQLLNTALNDPQRPPPAPHLTANHRGGVNVTFLDGSTRTIPLETHCWNDKQDPVRGAP